MCQSSPPRGQIRGGDHEIDGEEFRAVQPAPPEILQTGSHVLEERRPGDDVNASFPRCVDEEEAVVVESDESHVDPRAREPAGRGSLPFFVSLTHAFFMWNTSPFMRSLSRAVSGRASGSPF